MHISSPVDSSPMFLFALLFWKKKYLYSPNTVQIRWSDLDRAAPDRHTSYGARQAAHQFHSSNWLTKDSVLQRKPNRFCSSRNCENRSAISKGLTVACCGYCLSTINRATSMHHTGYMSIVKLYFFFTTPKMLFTSVLPPSELRAANGKNRKIPKIKKFLKFCFFEKKNILKGYLPPSDTTLYSNNSSTLEKCFGNPIGKCTKNLASML